MPKTPILHAAVVLGTRPEAIKLATVVQELQRLDDVFKVSVISTAQHRQMLDQVLHLFDMQPDVDLDLMRPDQGLAGLTARVMEGVSDALGTLRPDILVVQGDTTTAYVAAQAAFYARIPVAHVEAGLRSGDMANPFPEEANRCLISRLASLHFPPTAESRRHLLDEGVPPETVVVTGNTVVDALTWLRDSGRIDNAPLPFDASLLDGGPVVLATTHRRESFGKEMENVFLALRDIARAQPAVRIVCPLHYNPNVRAAAFSILRGEPRIILSNPLDYGAFVRLMRRSRLILTDSGGVQEEAPNFGCPVLVLRDVTERPEASRNGQALLVGTDRERIVREACRLLEDDAAHAAMSHMRNPFGDGKASGRIAVAMQRFMAGMHPVLGTDAEFVA